MKKTVSRMMYFAVLAALVCIGCGGDDGGQNKSLEIGNLLNVITGRGGDVSAPTTHTLTVNVSPAEGGSVSRSSNNISYKTGELVTVTAKAAGGWIFTGWSGDVNDTSVAVTVTMNRDLTLTANFIPKDAPTYTLTVKLEPNGGGNVSREPTRTVYSAGEIVTVTAAEADGYTFTGWSGDANGADLSVTVTMNRDLTLTANFQQLTYTFTTGANPIQGGTVSREPYKAVYTYGDRVTVTAAPTDGYTFTGWSGDTTGTAKSVTLTIDGNKTLTANFKQNRYTLTTPVSPSGYGTVLRNPNKDTYTYGEQVTVTATETPPSGDNYYAFNGWTGSLESKSNIVTITMDDNKTLTANFTRGTVPYYTLATISNQDVQPISRNPNNASYREGATVTVTAPKVDGYEFSGWSGASTSANNIVTVTMDSNKVLTANYRQLDYTLATDVNPAIGGRVSRLPNKDRYVSGEKVTVNATANPGYKFVGWTGVSTSKDTLITITMNSNLTLTANFEQVTYTLETNGNPINGGFVSRSPNRDTYTYNAEVTVTAEAANGYTFTGWTGASTSKEASVTITMNGNKTLTANFQQDQYTLTTNISPSDGGTISRTPPSNNQTTYTWGTTVTVTATPLGCYMFTGWSGTGAPTPASTNPVTITMDGNKTLTANFQKTYTLTTNVSPAGGGTVSRSLNQTCYVPGTSVTVEAVPASGYEFTGWSGASTSKSASVTVAINSDLELTANFQRIYTLTTNVSPAGGGTVSHSPNHTHYSPGTSVTVEAKPASGYAFTGWSGASTSTSASVTVTINSNLELTANFQPLYTVTVSSIGSGASSGGSYLAGATVTIIAGTAPTDYRFKNWTTTSSGVTFANANSATTTFTMPTNTVTVTANFERIYITDNRDGKKYRIVKIGYQTWMAENLNYQTTSGSWCYSNSADNCNKYGRLYAWNTANTVCPTGWHLPSRDEWGQLAIAAGGTGTYGASGTAGKKLKATSGWNSNGNGTDDFGFSALPGGSRNNVVTISPFNNAGYNGYWWTATATENGSGSTYRRGMGYDDDHVSEGNVYDYGFSVRCVED